MAVTIDNLLPIQYIRFALSVEYSLYSFLLKGVFLHGRYVT